MACLVGRLKGGKDYSSVKVTSLRMDQDSPLGSTLFLSLHGALRCVRYVMGTAGAVRLKIRRCRSTEARLACWSQPLWGGAVLQQ